jgi:hypothetical protein
MESLLLSCGALASPTMCRFIPALSDDYFPEQKCRWGSCPQCVGVNVFCVHEPQHAGHDPLFSYNIWCAKFYLRHTVRLSPINYRSIVTDQSPRLGNWPTAQGFVARRSWSFELRRDRKVSIPSGHKNSA